jgi:N-acetyl-alpha-D-muramate 1-phosphate uridylyltransferase
MIKQAIVTAAGLGQRMRPLSNAIPKPMVLVCGRPMIDYALHSLAVHGVERVVVNTHYQADVLVQHFKNHTWSFDVIISHEPVLLDTGGGIKKALSYLDQTDPVFVLAGDSIVVDAPCASTLGQMQSVWRDENMDILLSLQPLSKMILTKAVGDYALIDGSPIRTPDHTGGFVWNSVRILHPRIFNNTPDTPFSFLKLMDAAQHNNRLSAVIHEGAWHHLTTPQDVQNVNAGWLY